MIKYVSIAVLLTQALLWAQQKSYLELNQGYIREKRDSFTFPDTAYSQKERDLDREYTRRHNAAVDASAIKLDIINGNIERAKIRLSQASYTDGFTRPIQLRYLAMLHFIEGEYQKSLEFLEKKELKELRHQDNVCLLRTLNLIILDRAIDAQKEWSNCKKFIIGKDGENNIWLNSLLELKLAQETDAAAAPLEGLHIENERGDKLRRFLKLALYLNKQELIFPRVSYLSVEALQDPKTRELLGMLYFRDLELVKAYELIEDLSTPNSENIKGNILLAQNKLELAYAQFKLALQRKSNSQNALERILPTAWRLNQWSQGSEYAARLDETPENKDSKLALEAAFLTKEGKAKEAIKRLDYIINRHTNAQAMEVNQLYAYNSMVLTKPKKTYEHADNACRQQDAYSCWLRAQLLVWEDLTLLVKRKDKVFEDTEDLLGKYRSGFEERPIKEKAYISQKDIEELEDAQIKLLQRN